MSFPHARGARPEDAATVILARDASEGLEVYMTRRQDYLRFMGGYYVFPGGKVDPADIGGDILRCLDGFGPERALERMAGIGDPPRALGFMVAAARELYEEAGVLLAKDAEGRPADLSDPKLGPGLAELRKRLQADEITLPELLKASGLRLDLGDMWWFAHWITPATSPRRFSTHFYLAGLPEGQLASAFEEEISDARWVSPRKALDMWRSREWDMIPPTVASLDTLSRYGGVADALADFSKPPSEFRRTVWKG